MSKPHVVFIHLDLGIGGAESLVLNLAKATLSQDHDANSGSMQQEIRNAGNGNGTDGTGDGDDATKPPLPSGTVSIYTTHCSPTHCYDEVRPPHGPLSSHVHIRGAFLPRKFFFGGTALCSAIRMVYLTYKAKNENPNASVFVTDVLPTGVPYLAEYCNVNAGILFYCHFPDKLLTRDTVNGEVDSEAVIGASSAGTGGLVHYLKQLKSIYRWVLDTTEEWTMSFSDLIVVNSNFTMGEVKQVFPSLFLPQQRNSVTDSGSCDGRVQVLYPSIESSLAKERMSRRQNSGLIETVENSWDREPESSISGPIVSLNRFERKKNVALVLHAYDLLLERAMTEGRDATTANIPPLLIAGGYDPRNVENVEHLSELRVIADEILDRYNLPSSAVCSPSKSSSGDDTLDHDKSTYHANQKLKHARIVFYPSISNARRKQFLASASVWCYTPHREHFGIVPLEAMDAGVPVVAIKSGGPMETIVDGGTGYLVDYSPEDSTTTTKPIDNATVKGFADAIHKLLSDPSRSREMGQSGRQRVDKAFGMETFRKKWWEMLIEAQKLGFKRHHRGITSYPSVGWTLVRSLGEMIWVVLFAIIVTSVVSHFRRLSGQ